MLEALVLGGRAGVLEGERVALRARLDDVAVRDRAERRERGRQAHGERELRVAPAPQREPRHARRVVAGGLAAQVRVEVVGDLPRGGVARAGGEGERLVDDAAQPARHAPIERRSLARGGRALPRLDAGRGHPRRVIGEQIVRDRAEPPHVERDQRGAIVEVVRIEVRGQAARLLGRDVAGGARNL